MKNVFLIDDDPIQLRLGELLIKRHNLFSHCYLFTQARRALQYIADNYTNPKILPDIIILDLDMPGISGWDFLDLFKNVSPHIKKKIDVFVVSSSINAYAIHRFKQYTFVKGAFMKPVSLVTLHKITSKYNIRHKREAVFNKVMHH